MRHDRRRSVRFLCLMGLFTCPSAGRPQAAEISDRPNIVYILADDLGFGDLGCYGQKTINTPNLDRMATEGLRLTRHYAGSTVCAPSRCVFLTGLHTGHARIRGNQSGILRPEDITVAEVLRDAGYRTGCFGKWGVGNPPPIDDPARNGFDEFFGYISMFHAHNFYPEFVIRNGKRVALRNVLAGDWSQRFPDGRGVAQTRVDYVPHLVAREAIQFVRHNASRPFFLYLAMNVPHANNEAGRVGDRNGMEVPTYGEYSARDWKAPEKGFAAMIKNIDRDVGQVLQTLRQLELERRTLVIFTSDNGPHQEGGHQMEFFNSNGDLRGMKRDLYEGGLRVPFIAWWPGTVAAGQTSQHVSAFQDMLPTFAELAGVPSPPTDGISMVSTLVGQPREQSRHPHLYWEFQERGGRQAVLLGDWKGVRLMTSANPTGPIALYNLRLDPAERTDVRSRHLEVARRIAEIMAAEHTQSQSVRKRAGTRGSRN
ncbi:MAG: arylsulfatase [Planctomycetaceae bacterium]